jgi:undecaprenyl-diphosphatase
MNVIISIIILAIIQGLAELLPVSSSAHVIVAEKILGMDPSTPENALLLVMLHTGTMLAVILYFWKGWKQTFFSSRDTAWRHVKMLALATALTGGVGGPIILAIEHLAPHSAGGKFEIEELFKNLPLIALALACAGVLIILAGLRHAKANALVQDSTGPAPIGAKPSAWIGAIQGLCLPFRGFSRSGATISVGLLTGTPKRLAEEFSFALAVILTLPVIGWELHRTFKHHPGMLSGGLGSVAHMLMPGMLGLACSFVAGLLALQWLSRWLEKGRWHYFGYYCLFAAAAVLTLHFGFGY